MGSGDRGSKTGIRRTAATGEFVENPDADKCGDRCVEVTRGEHGRLAK
jgi:hypothetical protein